MNRIILALTLLLAPLASIATEKPQPAAAAPGTVTLPLADYNKLVDQSAKPPKRPESPPVPAVLCDAELRVRVAEGTARGTIAVKGEVFRAGPTEVVLVAGATLIDARFSGSPLPLITRDGVSAAILTGPAPFSIALDWGAAVTTEPGRASFVVPVPPAGSARMTVELPVETSDVHVEPGVITKRAAAGGKTVMEVTLEPGASTRVWWSSHEPVATAAERPARFLSEIRTLITLGEAETRLATLVSLNILQGEPARFEMRMPPGFEITGATGNTLETTEDSAGRLAVRVREPAQRRHHFLVTLERSNGGGSLQTEILLPSVETAQRETGEAAVEGIGTLELKATEGDGIQRIDVREAAKSLRGLARQPLLAAFRYQRKGETGPRLALEVFRYADAPVLAAVAERATVTTLVTSAGRTLSEVSLTVRNQAQPFLKVALPAGATLLSAEVAGAAVKPVKGSDGTRVPLLRTGFRPSGPYSVSFVYMQPGAPFGKKGDVRLALPAIDIPVTLLGWELFVPERYKAKNFAGSVIPESVVGLIPALFPPPVVETTRIERPVSTPRSAPGAGTREIWGEVTDATGGVLPGVTLTLHSPSGVTTQTTGINGQFQFQHVATGKATLTAELDGFATYVANVDTTYADSLRLSISLAPATVAETVTVTAEQPLLDTKRTGTGRNFTAEDVLTPSGSSYSGWTPPAKEEESERRPTTNAASANVLNLQRRVAGVLPVRIDIPRAGTSYRFYRPLVLEEETVVTFAYNRR